MASNHKQLLFALLLPLAAAGGHTGAAEHPDAGGKAADTVSSSPEPVPADCESLARLRLDTVDIHEAVLQPANEPVTGAHYPSMTGEYGAGPQVAGLPAFCRVSGSIHPEPGSDIRFEVWLPRDGWDGRFQGANNGGLAGSINYLDLAAAVRAGAAAASTDTGHQASPGDGAWARGHPEKVRDYGWRAIHEMTVVGKRAAATYYGRAPEHAYFIGCSNGGRQALMSAARFPEDYDGIIAGAPAARLTEVTLSTSNGIQAQMPPGAPVRSEQAALLEAEVLRQCDGLDGMPDGLVADPRQCRFDSTRLACGVSDSPQCFEPAQLVALDRIHTGAYDSAGRRIAYGFPPTGAEVGRPVSNFGWDGNVLVNFRSPLGDKTLTDAILTDLPATPIATAATLDFDRDPARLRNALGADLDADTDLTGFFGRGGKLIMWHGWADAILVPEATIAFHDAILRRSGPRAAEQLRLFMVPGVQHCAGGTGPGDIGQIGTPPPGAAPERNIGAALLAWVEIDRAPDTLIGRSGIPGMPMPAEKTREYLLCAYPAVSAPRVDADSPKAEAYACRNR